MKIPPAAVVVVCTFLIRVTIIGSDFFFYHSAPLVAVIGFCISQAISYFLYPLLGWMSDVYFTRYKVLRLAFVMIATATLVLIIAVILGESACNIVTQSSLYSTYTPIVIAAESMIMVCLAGQGLFEANAIQFGMEQLLEASSDQLGTFIHWYYWSLNLGRLILYYVFVGISMYYRECQNQFDIANLRMSRFKNNCKMYYICLLIIGALQGVLTVLGLIILVCNKKHLHIEQPGYNPLRLVYNVLKYTWKHKVPERRSAFTYWEADYPPRIDLGKNKYGGPFTTEDVEDTKAFFRIILLLTTLVGFYLSSNGYQLSKQLMQNECPSFWVLMVIGEPTHFTTLTIVVGIPLYQLARHCCYSQKYFPNMLKRMGFGLLCCLAKEITELVLLATQRKLPCVTFVDETDPAITCYYFESKVIDNSTGICSDIATISDGKYYCTQHNLTFLLLIIPYVLHGLAYLLVFMTALEFICAQAPLRLKGILIGIWYALLSIHYLVVALPEAIIADSSILELFKEVKAFLIAMSFFAFLYVSERYHYRVRDEVVNERFLVEEIYEREILLAAEYEREKQEGLRSMYGHLASIPRQQCYNAITNDQDSD